MSEAAEAELLPRGWYQYYVEAVDEYCPARVFSLDEAGSDAAELYASGLRWMVVFSGRTGPTGDRSFVHVRSFSAAAMTEQSPLTEQDALCEIAHMGYRIIDLPKDVFTTPPGEASARFSPTAPAGLVPRSDVAVPPPLVGWVPLDPVGSDVREMYRDEG